MHISVQSYSSVSASALLEQQGACVTADYEIEDDHINVVNTARFGKCFAAGIYIASALPPISVLLYPHPSLVDARMRASSCASAARRKLTAEKKKSLGFSEAPHGSCLART